jgi:hypothetical protein
MYGEATGPDEVVKKYILRETKHGMQTRYRQEGGRVTPQFHPAPAPPPLSERWGEIRWEIHG